MLVVVLIVFILLCIGIISNYYAKDTMWYWLLLLLNICLVYTYTANKYFLSLPGVRLWEPLQ